MAAAPPGFAGTGTGRLAATVEARGETGTGVRVLAAAPLAEADVDGDAALDLVFLRLFFPIVG
jgi:hypothetical protein